MINKTIRCPSCKNQITVTGNPGEKVQIICPKCNSKGIFTFPTKEKYSDNSYAIEVCNLTKKFNNFIAVDNISFSIKSGEIFGFLGPNGAGKTTTIKMLTTLLNPTEGKINFFGVDLSKNPLELKKRIGYMPDVPGFYDEMKASDVMHFYGEFYKIPKLKRQEKIDYLLKTMNLEGFRNKKVKTFSRGMKQKLGFATSLLNDPEILILDEPTIGLDPGTIRFFRKSIESLNKKGVTIFLSSHILSEVQAVCTKVGIINKGKIIAVDTIDSLGTMLASKGAKIVYFEFENMTEKAAKAVEAIPGVISLKIIKEKRILEIEVEATKSLTPIINKTLVENGINITKIESKQINLEDIFLTLTGGETNE